MYFKLYKSQIPVVEQAVETAALMLGTEKSRGYRLDPEISRVGVMIQLTLRSLGFLPPHRQ